jgi:hypothetical protein
VLPLPRGKNHLGGSQRRPALAATALAPGGALLAAWDDFGTAYPMKGGVDVIVELIPTPVVRLQDP